MNLLIIGNIAAGKTSLSDALINNGFCTKNNYYSIDDLRKEHSDGTFAGEFLAWANMLEAIQRPSSNQNSIYEFSGTGKNAWFVREAIKYSKENHKANWLVVYCLCDRNELLKRMEGRTYNVPIPYTFDNPSSSITYMSGDLQKKYGTYYWNAEETTVRTDQKDAEHLAKEVMDII